MGINLKADTAVLIFLALLGMIFFLLIANALQFKDKVFNTLYPKPESFAQSSESINGMIFQDIKIDDTTRESATVSWFTNLPATTRILVGISSDTFPLTSINDPNLTLDHQITIAGLSPNTNYFYKIVTENMHGEQLTSTVRKFRTKGS